MEPKVFQCGKSSHTSSSTGWKKEDRRLYFRSDIFCVFKGFKFHMKDFSIPLYFLCYFIYYSSRTEYTW